MSKLNSIKPNFHPVQITLEKKVIDNSELFLKTKAILSNIDLKLDQFKTIVFIQFDHWLDGDTENICFIQELFENSSCHDDIVKYWTFHLLDYYENILQGYEGSSNEIHIIYKKIKFLLPFKENFMENLNKELCLHIEEHVNWFLDGISIFLKNKYLKMEDNEIDYSKFEEDYYNL